MFPFSQPTPFSIVDHPFIPASASDSRSPCPALNTLANHGYLPRDGRNITILQLVNALRLVYSMSLPLAIILALVGVLVCGTMGTLDLFQLAAHNKIEHDTSLAHPDAVSGAQYAPTAVDKGLLGRMISQARPGHGLTLKDFARARVARQLGVQSHLDNFHQQIATGECSLTWLLMKNANEEVPVKALWQWYGEERLPDGYQPPAKTIGLVETHSHANDVQATIDSLTKKL